MRFINSKILLVYLALISSLCGDTIVFSNESVSDDKQWIGYYKFYNYSGAWIASVEVYENSSADRVEPTLMLKYTIPENDFKSRDAEFEWESSTGTGKIDCLKVQVEAGVGAKKLRIIQANIVERTISMTLVPKRTENGSNVEN